MPLRHTLPLLALLPCLFVAVGSRAQTLTTTVIDSGSGGDAGLNMSGALVSGNPAQVYYDTTSGELRFARNTAADGSGVWTISPPIIVNLGGNDLRGTALAVVNGNPAVVWISGSATLMYTRNANATGTGAWNSPPPTQIGTEGADFMSLAVVAGTPAVAYRHSASDSLKFARNANANGDGAWTVTTVAAGIDDGQYCSLAVVAGNPAISHYDGFNDDLVFTRCGTADGTGAWTSVIVDGTGNVGKHTTLSVVNGNPAIGYEDFTNNDLKYARANDATGTTWTTQVVDTNSGWSGTLAVIGGNPAMAYFCFSGGRQVKFARASTVNGTGAWTLTDIAPADSGLNLSVELYPLASGRPLVSYRDTAATAAAVAINATTSGSGAWTTQEVDSGTGGHVGSHLSAALVQGTPAVAYVDTLNKTVKFTRNPAMNGSGTWTTSTVCPADGGVTGFVRLAMIAGLPCVLTKDQDGDLLFARNAAADGSGVWTTNRVRVGSTDYPFGISGDFGEVGGLPAIVMRSTTALRYLRCSTPDGQGAWSEVTIVPLVTSTALFSGETCELAMVNGHPAVAYYDLPNTALMYARAQTPDGLGGWTTHSVNNDAVDGQYPSLAVIAGHPAIASRREEATVDYLSYHWALDPDGTLGYWDGSVAQTELGAGDGGISLAEVGGYPGISSHTGHSSRNLGFSSSSVTNGVGGWTRTDVEPFATFGFPNSLVEVNGRLGIAYYDKTNSSLKWAGVTEPPSTPDLNVELQSGVLVADGDTVNYGALLLGNNGNRVVVLRNAGTASLTGVSASLSGPDAGHFSLLGTPNATIVAGATSLFTVRFSPTTYGAKSALLTVTSNDPNENPYQIPLTGLVTFPDIALEQPANTPLPSGGTLNFPATATGANTSLILTLRNEGAASLTGLAASFSGPDASAFSVTSGAIANLAGGAATTFTVRFAPSDAGNRNAVLSLASNDPDENPYLVNLGGLAQGPEIAVEQPVGTNVVSGSVQSFGLHVIGGAPTRRTFTVRNAGNQTLTGIAASLTGPSASQFSISADPLASLSPLATTTLSVDFHPTTAGVKAAVLNVASNDGNENPFTVTLGGNAVLPGTLEEAFNPDVNGDVLAVAVQPDGKILIAGGFTTAGGQTRNRIARLLPDGTVEDTATFNPGTGAAGVVRGLAVQADGKIVVVGDFTTFNGQTRNRIARLLADGTLEGTGTFNPGTGAGGAVHAVALQPDGKILIGGSFTTVNGNTRNRIARLLADGTVESTTTFNPGTGANGDVRTLALDASGRIVLGGAFTQVNAQARTRIARLSSAGAVEGTGTFNTGSGAGGTVRALAIQQDGAILAGGEFTTFNGGAAGGLVRLTAAGAVQGAGLFNVGAGAAGGTVTGVLSLALQANGKILAGGDFTTFGGTAAGRVVLLQSSGALESATVFSAGSGADSVVRAVAQTADGSVLLGGSFANVNGTARNRFAKLRHIPASTQLDLASRLRVAWMRSGSAPEVSDVVFERSVDGGLNWTSLGAGTRINGGWERASLLLPMTGEVRARGRTPLGQGNGGSGLVEQRTSFNLTPEMSIQSVPLGVIPDGATRTLVESSRIGVTSAAFTHTVSNLGTGELTGVTASLSGAQAGQFSLNATGLPGVIPPGGSGTFTLAVYPIGSRGQRSVQVRVNSDDPNHNPYDITFTTQSYSSAVDTDIDGMNDWAESQLTLLGFNPTVPQGEAVAAYFAGAEANGLYSQSGLQALQLGAPVLARDTLTGQFLLTIGTQRAPAPGGIFAPMPVTAPQVQVNGQGKLEVRFTLPDNGAVFRLEAR